jgi:GMP synthase-like glutamine amidotransferase
MPAKPGLVLQHGPTGSPGLLGEWLADAGVEYEMVPVWELEELPDPAGRQFVASLGAIESVRDTEPPWVRAELDLLRRAVSAEVPVIGLCFGGQALSAALGGGVDKLPRPRVGWTRHESDVDWVAPGPWLYYHKEAMRVPPGAERLASSELGPAAFSLGPHLGVQFHPEVTGEILDRWARKDPELHVAGVTVEELAEQSRRCAPAAREAAFRLFTNWWERARSSLGRSGT